MKSYFISLLFLILPLAAGASETGGLCEDAATAEALRTAPGQDESSPATVVSITLLDATDCSDQMKSEAYSIQTEDQGGTATSTIWMMVRNSGDMKPPVCKVYRQVWTE